MYSSLNNFALLRQIAERHHLEKRALSEMSGLSRKI
jgi:hypothetical protein